MPSEDNDRLKIWQNILNHCADGVQLFEVNTMVQLKNVLGSLEW